MSESDTDTASGAMEPSRNRAMLAKYSGSKSTIKVELWLNLYEVETRGRSDAERIVYLMRYLTDVALNLFASDIAPSMDNLSWSDVRGLMTARFGMAIRHPLVAANKRFLKYSETVQSYYEDKLRLLRLAEVDDEATVAMLTDGMPASYHDLLDCCSASTPVEWLKHAVKLEANSLSRREKTKTRPSAMVSTATGLVAESEKRPPKRNFGNNKPETPCRYCKAAGEVAYHWHRECNRRSTAPKEPTSAQEEQTLVASSTAKPTQLLQIDCIVNGVTTRSVVDTSSTITVLYHRMAKRLHLKPDTSSAINIVQLDGQTRSKGTTSITITIAGESKRMVVHIISNFPYDLLLGLDAGHLFDLQVNLKAKQVFQASSKGLHLCLAAAAESINTLVIENSDLFAQEDTDVGRVSTVEHHIRLLDANHPPIALRPYRHSQIDQSEIRRQTTELKTRGLIRDSISPWSFPVTLANKKDGKKRLCIDYRRLNAITVLEREPIPLIQDVIDRLSKQRIFSTIDVAWGFWHIPLSPESIPKSAFITADGHFEWLVTPFGLKNSPMAFQRAIRIALGDLIGNGVDPYLDDIIVATEDIATHVAFLRKVFDRLRANHFRLREEKCLFGITEVQYLGFVISSGSYRPSPNKTAAVAQFPVPTDLKSLQRFIGLSNYYRQFIPDFSRIASPLTFLTRKGVPFKWSDEQQTAFNQLKTLLTSEPILTIFDPNRDIILQTDGSKVGIGAILMQPDDSGKNRVVAYFSRHLNQHEANYTTSEIECLAVVDAVEHFHSYLHCSQGFDVITDHSALQWLFSIKNPSGRLYRWSVRLSIYKYRIIHKPGKTNQAPDALSRAPVVMFIDQNRLKDLQHEIEKKEIRKLTLKDGLMAVQRKGISRFVVPKSLRPEVLSHYHEKYGHPGIEKTQKLVTQLYW